MLMLHMLQQVQAQSAFHHPHPLIPHAPAAAAPLPLPPFIAGDQGPVKSAPPSPSKWHRRVSLDEFYLFYDIEDVDRDRLAKIDFRPGDAIAKLPEAEWRGVGGFSTLAWERMLDISQRFNRDLRAGHFTAA